MRAAQLEIQIAAVRRELADALDRYRELGLQVSLLARQRNVAQRNLARTEQYLQSVQPGLAPLPRDRHAALHTATRGEARGSAGAARTSRAARRSDLRRKPRWRRAVESITSHAVPVRQLERELGALQQQLTAARDEYRQLEARAGRLEQERDQALVDLELARARALAGVAATPVAEVPAEQPAEPGAPAAPPDVASVSAAFQAAEEKLQRTQRANNDIQIALAERDDQVAALQSERERLYSEIEQLDARLSTLQQELAGARQSSQTLPFELSALRDDSERTASRDAERIAVLQQRIGELEAQLQAARQGGEALEQDLRAAAARQAAAEQERAKDLETALGEVSVGLQHSEQQRQALSEELHEQRSSVAAHEQELADLRAQDEQRRAEIDSLTRQLAAATQDVETVTATLGAAEQKLQRVQLEKNDSDIGLAERDDRVATLQAEREQLQSEIEQSEARFAALQQDLATAQQFNQVLTSELDAVRDELHRTGSRDGEQIAALHRRIAKIEAELEAARGESRARELDLQAAAASRRDLEQQRQLLAEALDAERSSAAVRDQQLVQLRARDEQRGAEIDGLTRQLLADVQEYETVSSERRSLAQELETLASESESQRSRDQRRLDDLQQRLAESEGARGATLQRVEELETALAEASAALLAGEKRREAQAVALQAQKNRLYEKGRQLEALEAQQRQSASEAYELKRRISAAEQRRARAQQEAQALKPELDELVAQLKSLQAALAAAEARVADAQQQRRVLHDELREQRSELAARERQIGDLQAREQRLQAELETVAQRLSAAERELVASSEKNRSLEQDREAVVAEYAATRHRDGEQLETLQQRIAELEPQLADARHEIEGLQLSLAEADYRQEVSDRKLAQLSATLERVDAAPQTAAQSRSPAPVPGSEESGTQAVQLIPGKALRPVAAATTVSVKRHRRRRWVGALAGVLLVAGLVAGAMKLRDLFWYDQPVAGPGNQGAPIASQPARPTVARAPAAAQVPGAAPEKPKQIAPYLRSLSRQAPDQAKKTGSEPTAADAASTGQTVAVPRPVAKAPRQQVAPYLQSLAKRRETHAGAGAHVEAYLMQEAASARAVEKPCDDAAGSGHPCSETEKDFMKDTVVGLPSGAKYKVIRNGAGRSPQPGDTVVVSYRGLLPDGTEFGSTGPGGDSEAFRLSQAIPGLREVLQYMEEGAKWEVYLPTELAFPKPGPLGAQEVIFVVELLAVLNPDTVPAEVAQSSDHRSLSARLLSDEESYWQTPTGGDTIEPDAGQPSDAVSEDSATPRQRIGAEAEEFLAEVAGQDGVVSLPSGLKYRVLKKGNTSGRSPTATDTVVLRYRGTLPDGREFDRSQGTAQFSVGELIPGWQEALQHMEEGARWELYIPPSLAHRGGTRKRGALGLQPLVYELELVSINQSDDTPANQ